MQYEIEYTLSPKLISKILWQEFMISNGWVIIFVGIGVIFISGITYLGGIGVWGGGFFTGIYVGFLFIRIISRFKSINAAKEDKDILRTKIFRDEYITSIEKDMALNVNWRVFTKIRILKNAWLFYMYDNRCFITVPSESINEELGSFIIRKIQENKGIVKERRKRR